MEWNKSLDKHPTFILLSSFVLGATLMWGILIFTLNDNREYLHKAEIENIKAQIGNKQSEIDRYQGKISTLEEENNKLKTINEIYWNCISQNKELTLYLKEELSKLIDNQKRTELEYYQTDSTIPNNNTINNSSQLKRITTKINKHDSYINPEFEIVIGIHDITINDTAIINLSINGNEIWNLKEISTGTIEHFMTKGKKHELIIKEINFVYNYVNIEIIELP